MKVPQSLTLLRFFFKGKKRRTFVYHLLQSTLYIASIFVLTTIFINFASVFAQISSVLSDGRSVVLYNNATWIDPNTVNSTMSQQLFLNGYDYTMIRQLGTVMDAVGLVVITLLIFKEFANGIGQVRLSIMNNMQIIKGALLHGASRKAVLRYLSMIYFIHMLAGTLLGSLFALYVILPVIRQLIQNTIFGWMVADVPMISYAIVLVPTVLVMIASIAYSSSRIREIYEK